MGIRIIEHIIEDVCDDVDASRNSYDSGAHHNNYPNRLDYPFSELLRGHTHFGLDHKLCFSNTIDSHSHGYEQPDDVAIYVLDDIQRTDVSGDDPTDHYADRV
ncbi:hypothetical protein VPNG_00873 [Cytospora leucostoma]|uniref:Uncharacterized protein n=1 Tax=Cytospora leucostoma TaxID=1230097 RepID=A0A423XM42_9PEZI|nr:hypothetical protein VPNG_00873 [Cytospora leucostoma]